MVLFLINEVIPQPWAHVEPHDVTQKLFDVFGVFPVFSLLCKYLHGFVTGVEGLMPPSGQRNVLLQVHAISVEPGR